MWWIALAAVVAYALCALAARWVGIAWLWAIVESGKPRSVGQSISEVSGETDA